MLNSEIRTYPLIDYFESLGYQTELYSGKKIIRTYTNEKEELDVLYSGTGLRNISHFGVLELKGNDVLDFLHRISTNSIKNLQKEFVVDTLFTSDKGRIIDLVKVLNFDSHCLMITSAENKFKVFSWLDKFIINDDVHVADINGKYTLLELLGPQADSFITLVCGNVVNNIQPDTFKIVNTEGLIFFLLKLRERNRFKYWIIADSENSQKLIEFMQENKGAFDFAFIGEDAYNVYRVENGIPAAPNELNDEYNPHEANLIQFVDFKKGCYIGQEVIARLDSYDKVQKHLTGVKFLNEHVMNGDMNIVDEQGLEAGKITTKVYSCKCKGDIGLAYIKKNYNVEGTKLKVKAANGTGTEILIKSLPFRK